VWQNSWRGGALRPLQGDGALAIFFIGSSKRFETEIGLNGGSSTPRTAQTTHHHHQNPKSRFRGAAATLHRKSQRQINLFNLRLLPPLS
jgi:hypothetical protein